MLRPFARSFLLAACMVPAIGTALAAESTRIEGEYAWAQAKSAPAKLMIEKSSSAVKAIALPLIDPSLVADAQRFNRSAGVKAIQIGINRAMREGTGTTNLVPDLQWQLRNGMRTAQLRIASPDAAALRVALAFRNVPEGIELRVTGRDGEPVIGPVSAADLRVQLDADGRYWTPVTEGDAQWIEVSLPAGTDTGPLGLVVEAVSHLFTSAGSRFKEAKGKGIGDSGACEIDVACVPGPSAALLDATRSVARMVYTSAGGSHLCTGTLLNDADPVSQVPYFMTASHCIDTQAEAGTLNTYWFYDAEACGGIETPVFTLLAAGATLLVNRPELDSTLLRLLNMAPTGAYFSGYDASIVAMGAAVTVVHHPLGDMKKVSQGRVTGFSALGDVPGLAAGFTTVGYTLGSTEGGSSGSAVLTNSTGPYLLRGTLYGGAASCASSGDFTAMSENFDYYSRFDQFYFYVKTYVGPIEAAQEILQAVEFHNVVLNHYFMTSERGEMNFVDNGSAGPGWIRTGQAFNVLPAITDAFPTSSPTCRFYGTPGIGPNSHFYTADANECNLVKSQAGWTYEGINFVSINPTGGNCPAGTIPVYRAYNNRFAQNDSNHRYSTNLGTLLDMAGSGWSLEGVVLCAPI